jgi:D-3-phosphoglycerate dehydrogenase
MILNFDSQFIEASNILEDVINITDKKDITDELYEKADGLVVRLGVVLNSEFLSRFKDIKFVATITTGLDHIDLEFCNNNNIHIISLKNEIEFLQKIHATPECTWGLLLSLMRRIPWAYESVLDGRWDRNSFFGNELYGKCFGVIGFGRVGKMLGRYASAFRMSVNAYDIKIIEDHDYKVSQVSLETLLKTSDIISINLHLNKETKYFLNDKHFKMMKKSAILLNSSRGALIDEKALLNALEQKQIAGAALDVLADENVEGVISDKHPLLSYASRNDNLLITPHIAGSAYESMKSTAIFIAEKIRSFYRK